MQIRTDEEKKELKQHGDYTFPVRLSEEMLSRYEGGSFMWHWHSEIELTLIRKGCIDYHVNGEHYLLKEGDGIFCNSNALHSGYRVGSSDCQYFSVTFHPKFIYGFENSVLQTKYVQPILNTGYFSSSVFCRGEESQDHVLSLLWEIFDLYCKQDKDMEFRLHLILSEIWFSLYQRFLLVSCPESGGAAYIGRLKDILEYIHTSYRQPLTLEEIAEQAHLSKSECCRFFKKHMHMTLFDYLLYYRIQQSLPLLKEGQCTIAKAAELSGFSSACYYSKIFRREMHCTPKQYQNSFIDPDGSH